MPRNMSRAVCALGFSLLFVSSGLNAAEIFYLDQTRTLSASASAADSTGMTGDSAADSAANFGIFNSLISADALLPFAFGHGDASQNSALDLLAISAVGTANATHSWDALDGGSADGSAASSFNVLFELDESAEFTLDVDLSVLDAVIGTTTSVSLIGPGGTVFTDVLDTDGLSKSSVSGVLAPGQYTLTASASADSGIGNPSGSRSSFSANLVIPEPATLALLVIGVCSMLPRVSRTRRN